MMPPASAMPPVHLPYTPPYDWPSTLGHLAMRTIEGVESIADGTYRRAVQLDGRRGTVTVAHAPAASSLVVTVAIPGVGADAVASVLSRVRRMFDLEADVAASGAHLSRDPFLAPMVRARPGLRVPGGWDGFELAMRAVLGQQVTLQAARRLAGQLARICDEGRAGAREGDGPLGLVFPTAAQVAGADLSALGMPDARRKTLTAVAQAAVADPAVLTARDGIEATVARLRAIRGIGDWTAHYIALRACREPDAFPASDIGLLRGATRGNGPRPTPTQLLALAERWRPFRAHAAQHLWAHDAASRADIQGARAS